MNAQLPTRPDDQPTMKISNYRHKKILEMLYQRQSVSADELAAEIRRTVKVPVIAVGLITSPEQAEEIIATGDADMIAIARTALYDPRWPWHAAAKLGASVAAAPQYLAAAPRGARAVLTRRG